MLPPFSPRVLLSLLLLGAASAAGCDGCSCLCTQETCEPCTTGTAAGGGGSTGTECDPGQTRDCPHGEGGQGGQGGQGPFCGTQVCTADGRWDPQCYDVPVDIPGNGIDEDCDGEDLPLTAALAPVPSDAMPSRFYLKLTPAELWDPTSGQLAEQDVPSELSAEDDATFTLTRPILSGSMFVTAPELRPGLTWADPLADDRFEALIAGSRIEGALDDKGALTLEAVVQTPGTAATGAGSAILYFGPGPDYGELDLRFNAPDELVFYWKGQAAARWNPTLFQRCTLHLVVDTSQSTAAARVLLYRNGKLVPPSVPATTVPALNEAVSFPAGSWFVVGNRRSGARAFPGTLYHFGVYGSALSAGDVLRNHDVLRIAEGLLVEAE